MIKREAQAVWRGGKDGKGELTTSSGVLKGTPYSFSTRFEDGFGTNPEELIGAAHAGCFSMALGIALAAAGFNPEELKTASQVFMEKQSVGWTIIEVKLSLQARIPEISNDRFQEIAQKAKAECPVSRLLKAGITLEAKLV